MTALPAVPAHPTPAHPTPAHPTPARAAPDAHTTWCVQHSVAGCEGQVISLPGTQLLVWLSAPSSSDPRLIVEGPGGIVEVPV